MIAQKIAVLGEGLTAKSVKHFISQRSNLELVSPDQADLVIASPGIPPSQYPRCSAPIISEIEWAYQLFQESGNPPQLIAVTGTNGKSTVTAMIAKVADIPYAGNIGIPLIHYVGLEHEFPQIVVEVSSYQGESLSQFTPDVGVFLNLSPDHLARHNSFQAYAQAKCNCFQHQGPQHYFVYNADDAHIESLCEHSLAELVPFTEKDIFPEIKELEQCPGKHNQLNAVAALKVAQCLGISQATALQRLREFRPLKHRLEFVAEVNQRQLYNDSKATNPDATTQAIEAFPEKSWVILCGEDKQLELSDFLTTCIKKTQGIVVFGDISQRIQDELVQLDASFPLFPVSTLKDAVETAMTRSQPGDIILFSPASSSQDEFDGFEHRGDCFKDTVTDYAETLLV